MYLIAHRGNLNGPNPKEENKPEYILAALDKGYHVEVDVWLTSFDGLYLGHDCPLHAIEVGFLQNDKLWCHAKNLAALSLMMEKNIQCFWHESDDYTLTSSGFIWTYPGKNITNKSIIVCDDLVDTRRLYDSSVSGVCSDYVGELK